MIPLLGCDLVVAVFHSNVSTRLYDAKDITQATFKQEVLDRGFCFR